MNPNVDVVDILSVHELAVAPGTADATWELVLCNPATGTSYRINGSDYTAIISDIIGSGIIEPDRVYVVDRGQPDDPTSGTDTVNDTFLDGKVFSLELRGVGFLEKGVEWDNDVVGGGWRLLGGTLFNSAEFYTVHFHPQISDVIASPNAIGKFSDGVQLIVGNTSVTSGMFRKLMVLTNGYTVDLNASYPENIIHPYTHNGPTNKQGVLTAPSGQTFSWNGGTTDTLWLGKNERVGLIRSGDTWYVVYDTMGYDKVGHIVPGRLPGANQIIAQGQTVLRADYPRLLDYITRLNAAYPGVVANAATWPANKTLWGFGNGTTTIQVPDLRGYFPRWLDLGAGVDADRNSSGLASKPGSSEPMAVQLHNHTDGDFNRILRAINEGTGTSFDPGLPNEPDLRTSTPMLPYGGTETRPVNAAELPLIYI
jgi:hypothetical protein